MTDLFARAGAQWQEGKWSYEDALQAASGTRFPIRCRFGYMDGGIDLVYLNYLGSELQERLQGLLLTKHCGELPVGQPVIVPTAHAHIPFLVSAPTMRVPGSIAGTPNAYLAFRAALIAVVDHNAMSKRRSNPLSCQAWAPGSGTRRPSAPHGR